MKKPFKKKRNYDYVLVPDIYIFTGNSSLDYSYMYWKVEKGTYLADEMNGTIFKIYKINGYQSRILPENIFKDENTALKACKKLNRITTEHVMRLAHDSWEKIKELEARLSKVLKF